MKNNENYKEDLESARGWYKIVKEQNNQQAIEILEDLFPELKNEESEDERIRKEIVELFKAAQRDGICKPIRKEQFEKIFAWLEKHKEKSLDKGDEETLIEINDYIANAVGLLSVTGYMNNHSRNEVAEFLKTIPNLIKELMERAN